MMKMTMKIMVGLVVVALSCGTMLAADTAADLFKTKCAACHGPDGSKENKAMGVKPLSSPDVQKESDADLAAAIEKGKGKMPAYETKLTKEQVNDLVKYVRTLKK